MRTCFYSTFVSVCLTVLSGGVIDSSPAIAQENLPAKQSNRHSIKPVESADTTKPLEERLQARATFQAKDAPLQDFAEELGKSLDSAVILATKQMEEAGVNPQTPMTYNLRNVRIRTGLGLILSEVGLSYVIKDDVLVITTPSGCGCEQLVTRVYNCCDLLALEGYPRSSAYHLLQLLNTTMISLRLRGEGSLNEPLPVAASINPQLIAQTKMAKSMNHLQ